MGEGEWTLDWDSNHCSFLSQLHVVLGCAAVWKLGQGWDIDAAASPTLGCHISPLPPMLGCHIPLPSPTLSLCVLEP